MESGTQINKILLLLVLVSLGIGAHSLDEDEVKQIALKIVLKELQPLEKNLQKSQTDVVNVQNNQLNQSKISDVVIGDVSNLEKKIRKNRNNYDATLEELRNEIGNLTDRLIELELKVQDQNSEIESFTKEISTTNSPISNDLSVENSDRIANLTDSMNNLENQCSEGVLRLQTEFADRMQLTNQTIQELEESVEKQISEFKLEKQKEADDQKCAQLHLSNSSLEMVLQVLKENCGNLDNLNISSVESKFDDLTEDLITLNDNYTRHLSLERAKEEQKMDKLHEVNKQISNYLKDFETNLMKDFELDAVSKAKVQVMIKEIIYHRSNITGMDNMAQNLMLQIFELEKKLIINIARELGEMTKMNEQMANHRNVFKIGVYFGTAVFFIVIVALIIVLSMFCKKRKPQLDKDYCNIVKFKAGIEL